MEQSLRALAEQLASTAIAADYTLRRQGVDGPELLIKRADAVIETLADYGITQELLYKLAGK